VQVLEQLKIGGVKHALVLARANKSRRALFSIFTISTTSHRAVSHGAAYRRWSDTNLSESDWPATEQNNFLPLVWS
jgi:hypothetical protein